MIEKLIAEYGGLLIALGLLLLVLGAFYALRGNSSSQEPGNTNNQEDDKLPAVGQEIDFPDSPYRATLQIEKVDEDNEGIVASVFVKLPPGQNC